MPFRSVLAIVILLTLLAFACASTPEDIEGKYVDMTSPDDYIELMEGGLAEGSYSDIEFAGNWTLRDNTLELCIAPAGGNETACGFLEVREDSLVNSEGKEWVRSSD